MQTLYLCVAGSMGSDEVSCGIRTCVDEHWNDIDFSVGILRNAFNLVSREAVFQMCGQFFQICYLRFLGIKGCTFFLWVTWLHQQLGPFLFAMVLHKVAIAITQDIQSVANSYFKLGIWMVASWQATSHLSLDLIIRVRPSSWPACKHP